MNATIKHDFHPDAESLSAFAEQALSGRERRQVLAHLAVCRRCRQVAALAQRAGLDTEVAPVTANRPAIQPFAWLRFWRFAWIPAAALAATVTLAVFVHMRRVEQSAEMARIESKPVTRAAATPEAPAQQEQAQAAPPAAAPKAAKSPTRASRRASKDAARDRSSQEPVGTAAMPALVPDEPVRIEHHEGARAEVAPSLAAAGTPQRRMYAASRAQAPATVHGGNSGAAVNSTEQVTVSSPQIENQAQSAPRPAAPAPSGFLVTSDGAAKRTYLPSSLPVESMAAAGPRVLAIDSAGALFLSEDSGDTWKHVTPQWTGRAVKVRRQMVNSGTGAVPTEFFELLNDQSQVWLSTDGKTWTVK